MRVTRAAAQADVFPVTCQTFSVTQSNVPQILTVEHKMLISPHLKMHFLLKKSMMGLDNGRKRDTSVLLL